MRTSYGWDVVDVAGQGYLCQPSDNSGKFPCHCDEGSAAYAVHLIFKADGSLLGYFCRYHSPFDHISYL